MTMSKMVIQNIIIIIVFLQIKTNSHKPNRQRALQSQLHFIYSGVSNVLIVVQVQSWFNITYVL